MPPGITNGSFAVTQNRTPVTQNGLASTDIQTLTGNNTTVAVPIFGITGTVLVNALYGVVTTALGVNNTAAYFRLNDGAAQSNITLNTGTTISAAPVGSTLIKKDLATAALTLLNASQERVSEPTTLETFYFSPFTVQQKTGAIATNIEFVYTTTDTPTSGTIQFFLGWIPLTSTSSVAAL